MKKIFIIGLIGALTTLVLAVLLPDLFRSWELKTVDMRFIFRGELDTSSSLVMVDADDASAEVYGPWPWDRAIHAKMIAFLTEAEATVVTYDILFAHPLDPDTDALLTENSKALGNVIYPVAISLSEKETSTANDNSANQYLWEDALPADLSEGLFATDKVISPLPGLARKESLGHIATNRDIDGIVRRVPLIVRHHDKLLPSLAFQTVLNFLQVSSSAVRFTGSSIILSGTKLPGENGKEDIVIPVDSHGQMTISEK